MPQMRPQAECRPCLDRLIDLTVELASNNPDIRAAARSQAQAVLATEFSPEAIPACIANKFHQIIKTVTGNPDPFRLRKKAETEIARQLADEISRRWRSFPDSSLALAAAGNALDFFRSAAEIARDMLSLVHFTSSQLLLWHQRLQLQPGILLFLADNAGEQFFDFPLVKSLRHLGWQVLYVVKGGPIQNDLSLQDLSDSGLRPALEPVVDTGAMTVGLELAKSSFDFQQLYSKVDLILAKGMGHFETLAHFPDPRLFFLLQAKCTPVADALGVPVGSFVLRNSCF